MNHEYEIVVTLNEEQYQSIIHRGGRHYAGIVIKEALASPSVFDKLGDALKATKDEIELEYNERHFGQTGGLGIERIQIHSKYGCLRTNRASRNAILDGR